MITKNEMISIISVLLIFVITYNGGMVSSCGMTTHNEVARRAFNFSSFQEYPQFKSIIPQYLSSFQAGAAFPDWGYDCGNSANQSEAAHWPPFLRNATVYLLKTYPQPWSEAGVKLAVFLMGVMSHQVADISWHSIAGNHEGLIAAMAAQDFNGVYGTAHTNADVGGEYVLAYNYDLSWLEDRWDVPVEDVKNIYSMMNYDVSEITLIRCNAILFAGAMAVKEGGRLLYPEIASKSQFLVDHYQDYFNGGLDDMAMWTTYCWPVLMGWMEGQEIGDFCALQPDPSWSHMALPAPTKHYTVNSWRDAEETSIYNRLSSKITNHIQQNLVSEMGEDGSFTISLKPTYISPAKFESHGDYFFSLDQEYAGLLQNQKKFNTNNYIIKSEHETGIKQLESNFSAVYGNSFYSYFGRDIQAVDLNGDGIDDLLITAPGEGVPGAMQLGCIYYIILGQANSTKFSNSDDFEIADIADGKVCGTEVHARFGWSVTALDFNMDGTLDLVVGAPSSSNADTNYYGATYVYFGVLNGLAWTHSPTPSMVINGTNFHDECGSVLTVGDCNGDGSPDLILGMPNAQAIRGGSQRGKVAIFYSSSKRQGQTLIVDTQADWMATGSNDYEWFGRTIEVSQSNGATYLLVGSPNYHYYNDSLRPNIGKLSCFSMTGQSHQLVPQFVIYGHYQYDKLGYNFKVVNGSFLGIYDQPILALSLPTRCVGDDNTQVGEVIFIEFVNVVGSHDLNDTISLLTVEGDTKYSRFGESLLLDMINPQTDSAPNLFIGAPLWTDTISTGSGCVFSFDGVSENIKKTRISANSLKRTFINGFSVLNHHKDSRFGYSVVLADVNNDGQKDLLVGADRDSTRYLEGGAMNIFLS